jgi:hypothetical protein
VSVFSDQLAADLPVFLNPEEFGKVRSIDLDGAPVGSVACVLDDERVPDDAAGVYRSESTLWLKASDLPSLPVITQRIAVDGKLGTVVHVDEADGMLSLRLQWFES